MDQLSLKRTCKAYFGYLKNLTLNVFKHGGRQYRNKNCGPVCYNNIKTRFIESFVCSGMVSGYFLCLFIIFYFFYHGVVCFYFSYDVFFYCSSVASLSFSNIFDTYHTTMSFSFISIEHEQQNQYTYNNNCNGQSNDQSWKQKR